MGGVQDALRRQQTLRNTIAWSYDLLNDSEQRLFRRLSVFVGGVTLEAIEAVSTALGDEPEAVLDDIASLIDKSLLRQSEHESEQPRFVMLETIREYGWEALGESLEAEATRKAHAAYFLALAEEAEPELQGPQIAEWMRRLEQEHDNLRAAMGWLLERGEAAMALRMGIALCLFLDLNVSIHEGWNFLERALVGSEHVDAPLRAMTLLVAGYMAILLGHFERGDALGQESLVLSRETGDKNLIAWSLSFLALVTLWQGEYAGTRGHFEESLALFRELNNTYGTALSLNFLAMYALLGPGDPDLAQAQVWTEESLALFRDVGSRNSEALALASLGEIMFFQGDTTTARLLLEQSCKLYREIGNEAQFAFRLSLLGKMLAAEGNLVAARAACEEGLVREIRVYAGQSSVDIPPALESLAAVVVAQGEPTWAARLLGRAEAQRETFSWPLPPLYRADYEHSVALARTQLDDLPFAAAWAEGRAMTLEQVFAARGPVRIPEAKPTSQTAIPPPEK